jgi:hypothetical protein
LGGAVINERWLDLPAPSGDAIADLQIAARRKGVAKLFFMLSMRFFKK